MKYVIYGTCGAYSDWEMWNFAVVDTEETAKKITVKLNWWLRENDQDPDARERTGEYIKVVKCPFDEDYKGDCLYGSEYDYCEVKSEEEIEWL